MPPQQPSRRKLLASGSAGVLGLLAGCAQFNDSSQPSQKTQKLASVEVQNEFPEELTVAMTVSLDGSETTSETVTLNAEEDNTVDNHTIDGLPNETGEWAIHVELTDHSTEGVYNLTSRIQGDGCYVIVAYINESPDGEPMIGWLRGQCDTTPGTTST